MPWAGEGKVSTSPIVGGVEITDDQYEAAIAAICAGKAVTVRNGFRIVGGATPVNTDQPTLSDYQNAIQNRVDQMAVSRQFNDGVTLASYVNSTIPQWKAEALAFVAWRDAVWAYAYGELAKFENGQRPQPTVSGFVQELPEIVWPGEGE